MKIIPYRDGKLITLSTPLDSRDKILNLAYFIVFFLLGVVFIKMTIQSVGVIEVQILCSILGLACLGIAFRFVNKAMMIEQIFVNAKELRISKGSLPVQKQVFELSSIAHFRYLDKSEVARHPLAGESFDYLGFQTEQKMIEELYGDNRLGFDYNGKTVTFGPNIYSWEFDEILKVLEEYGYAGRRVNPAVPQ